MIETAITTSPRIVRAGGRAEGGRERARVGRSKFSSLVSLHFSCACSPSLMSLLSQGAGCMCVHGGGVRVYVYVYVYGCMDGWMDVM